MMNDKSNLKNHNRSGSESSVIEDIKSQSTESKKNDSSDDTMTHSHENETLDEPISTTKKPSKSMPMPLAPREYAELRALSELDFSIGYTDQIHKRMMNDKSNLKNHNRSRSESSVIEDIKSQSTESKKNDSSDDTMTHSHENETFDEPISTLFGINMSPFVYHVCDEYLASKSESESDFSKGYTDQIHKRMMNDKSNLKNHNRSRSESSVIEDIKSQSTESKKDQIHKRMMNDKSNLKNHNRSRSESSVIEDIKSQSTESKKNDSSDDTMTHSYENETLDEPTSTTKKPSKSMSMPKSPLVSLNQYFTNLGPRSLFRELARNLNKSEDITAYIESQFGVKNLEHQRRELYELSWVYIRNKTESLEKQKETIMTIWSRLYSDYGDYDATLEEFQTLDAVIISEEADLNAFVDEYVFVLDELERQEILSRMMSRHADKETTDALVHIKPRIPPSVRESQIVNKETLEQTGNNVDMGNFTNPTKGVVPAGVPEIERLTPQQFQQLVSEFKEHLVNKDARSLELPVYKMTSSPKGYCVIINNRHFKDPQHERRGTEVDAAALRDTFTKLDFKIQMRENLTDIDMIQLLARVAHIDHKDYDCLVICILSHGELNHICGTNWRPVAIRDLTGAFQTNRCPSLAGKPKLFFLQACQGTDDMGGGEIEKDAIRTVETDNDKEIIPNESDFLLGYSTAPGYAAYRNTQDGSLYIRKLCEVLQEYSKGHDLLSILVKVNEEVSRINAHVDGGIFKQTPAPVVTLRKKLYFF